MKLQMPRTPPTLTAAALRPRPALAALAIAAAVAVLSLASPLRAAATWSTGGPDQPITSNRTVTVSSGAETESTPLTGSTGGVTLTKLGTGTLTLSGTLDGYVGNLVLGSATGSTTAGGWLILAGDNRAYAGNVTVGYGSLAMASDTNFGTGTYTLYGNSASTGAFLRLTGTTGTAYSKGIALRGSYNAITTDNAVTLSGVLGNGAAAGGFHKQGAGTLTLTGANTYTGETDITAGTLALAGGGSIATSSLVAFNDANATFDISGISTATATIKALVDSSSTKGSVVLGSKELLLNGTNNTEYYGTIAGTAGSTLTRAGTGITRLYGDNSAFEGKTKVTGGTLSIGANTNVGVIIDGGTLELRDTGTYAKGWTIGNSTDSKISVGSGLTATLTNPLVGTSGTLTKQGAGTLVLAGVNTGYAGNVTVGGGTLAMASDDNFGTGTYTLYYGTLSLTGESGTDYTRGNIALRGNGGILTANDVTYSGVLGNSADGAGGFTKQGAGTLTLTGANTYTGTTSINAGTLALAGGGSIATSSEISFGGNNTTFDISGISADTATIKRLNSSSSNTGVVVNLGNKELVHNGTSPDSYYGTITGNATSKLTKAGSGYIYLYGDNSAFAGTTRITGGYLNIGSDSNAPGDTTADGTARRIIDGGILELRETGTYAKGWTIGSSTASKIRIANGLTATLTSPLVGGTGGTLAKTNAGTLILTGTLAGYQGDLVVGDATGSLTVGGKLVLAGDNRNYAGNVTVGTGTLAVASADSFGTGTYTLYGYSASSSYQSILSLTGENGTIYTRGNIALRGTYNRNTIETANNVTLNGVLGDGAAAGGFNKTGAGTLTLTGANTYTEGTAINAGKLVVSGAGAHLGPGALTFSTEGNTLTITDRAAQRFTGDVGSTTLANNAQVTVSNGATLEYGDAVSDNFYAPLQLGSGTTLAGLGTIRDANASTGKTAVTLAAGSTLAPGAIGSTTPGTLTFNKAAPLTFSGLTYAIDANATTSDTIALTGTGGATFDGTDSTINFVRNDGSTWKQENTWDILTATGDGGLTASNLDKATVNIRVAGMDGPYIGHWSAGLTNTATAIQVKTDYRNLQVTWDGADSDIASTTAWKKGGVALTDESFIANDSLIFGSAGSKSVTVGAAATVSGLTVEATGYTFSGEKLTGTATAKDADYTPTGALLVTANGGATFDNALDFVSAEIAGAATINNTLTVAEGVTVRAGGTLSGTGTITGNTHTLEAGSTLAPGAIGDTTAGKTLIFQKTIPLTLSGLTYAIDADASTSDKIALTGAGNATFDGTGSTINFARNDGGTWKQEKTWDILTATGGTLTVQNLAAATLNMSAADRDAASYTGHWSAGLTNTATAIQVKTGYRNLQVTWNGADSTLASATAWQKGNAALSNESFITNDFLVFGAVGNKSVNVGTAATVSGLTVEATGYTFGGEKLTGTTTAKDADYTVTGALLVTANGGATFDNALEFVSAEIAGAAAFNSTLTLTAADGMTVLTGGTLGGTGTITGDVSIADGGMLAPGNSPGALTVNGNVTLGTGATALFEIGGAGDGEYDRLIISAASGSAALTLGGTLELVAYNGYTGAEGDTFRLFDLVSGATVTGEFEGGINGFALGDGLA
ncbi:MAG: autotransporter-associated beta strand repeat-containing protein, partial [Opitutaceae bacterium]|nr:autotransporter-associated beta strand repeat-containing protein [Opitutaceae bacterium]